MYQHGLIFLGAGFGGICRYAFANFIYLIIGRQFPYGTMVVNITGCFLMGILYALILDRLSHLSEILRPLILIGFLGGYTTFSSFSIETLNLYENGYWIAASLNILLSVGLCIIFTGLGLVIGRGI